MKKNVEKGLSYSWAFARMRDAKEAGYFIESAAVAESIIADRVHSYLLGKGAKLSTKKDSFPSFFDLLKALEKHLTGKEGFTVNELHDFRASRNRAIHQVAKSQPGEPTMPIHDFLATAKTAAADGNRLARRIAEWHRKSLPPALKAAKRKRAK